MQLSIFNQLEDEDIDKIYRLGHWEEDKVRPLLVVFKTCETKDEVMANLRNLTQPVQKFTGISISHDLPPKDREEIKRLVEVAKQEHDSKNVDDNSGNYKLW